MKVASYIRIDLRHNKIERDFQRKKKKKSTCVAKMFSKLIGHKSTYIQQKPL